MRINKKVASQIADTVKDVCGQDINFIDEQGIIYASTNPERLGDFHEVGLEVAKTHVTIEVMENMNYKGTQNGVNIPVFHNGDLLSVIGITGKPEEVRQYAYLALRITKLLIREQELEAFNRSQKERNDFIVRTLLKGEITNREYLSECLNELKIDEKVLLRVIVIKLNTAHREINISLLEERLYRLFHSTNVLLYSYNYPNEYVVIVKEDMAKEVIQKIDAFAESNEGLVRIGVGSVQKLYHLAASYNAGEVAIKSLNGSKERLAEFDKLDIEMIIGSLENNIRENYLEKALSRLSKEDIELLRIYYQENMSLTATCQKLFLHKNTLQYKLDRIGKISGYNPRNFKDAVVLYIAGKM